MDHVTSGFGDDVTTCDELLSLVVDTIDQLNAARPQPDIRLGNMSAAESCHVVVDQLVNKIVAPVICVFGIIGNLLSLVVLTRKRLQRSMNFIEKSANVRFIALAVADMIFCLVYFLTLVVPLKAVSYRPWALSYGHKVMHCAWVPTVVPKYRTTGHLT